jgi:hypothetical protein
MKTAAEASNAISTVIILGENKKKVNRYNDVILTSICRKEIVLCFILNRMKTCSELCRAVR